MGVVLDAIVVCNDEYKEGILTQVAEIDTGGMRLQVLDQLPRVFVTSTKGLDFDTLTAGLRAIKWSEPGFVQLYVQESEDDVLIEYRFPFRRTDRIEFPGRERRDEIQRLRAEYDRLAHAIIGLKDLEAQIRKEGDEPALIRVEGSSVLVDFGPAGSTPNRFCMDPIYAREIARRLFLAAREADPARVQPISSDELTAEDISAWLASPMRRRT